MHTMLDWSTLYRGSLAWLPQRTIFLTRAGSHAYGLATPESDVDIRGVVIPPQEYFGSLVIPGIRNYVIF